MVMITCGIKSKVVSPHVQYSERYSDSFNTATFATGFAAFRQMVYTILFSSIRRWPIAVVFLLGISQAVCRPTVQLGKGLNPILYCKMSEDGINKKISEHKLQSQQKDGAQQPLHPLQPENKGFKDKVRYFFSSKKKTEKAPTVSEFVLPCELKSLYVKKLEAEKNCLSVYERNHGKSASVEPSSSRVHQTNVKEAQRITADKFMEYTAKVRKTQEALQGFGQNCR